jgi:hypothetical protein
MSDDSGGGARSIRSDPLRIARLGEPRHRKMARTRSFEGNDERRQRGSPGRFRAARATHQRAIMFIVTLCITQIVPTTKKSAHSTV